MNEWRELEVPVMEGDLPKQITIIITKQFKYFVATKHLKSRVQLLRPYFLECH